MSAYVKKHRRHIFGIALPVFIVFFVALIGINVVPGWIQPSLGGIDVDCTQTSNTETPLLTACDRCAGETCTQVSTNSFECTAGPPPPPCPFGPQPECFDQCVTTLFQSGTFFAIAECVPNDAFCQNISGGTESNSCRTGTCVGDDDDDDAVAEGFPSNPTGCDYEFDSGDPLCINCEDPLPSGVTNCGNGVCEKPGEDPDNCSEDCRVPGFTGTVPATQEDMDDACGGMTQIDPPTITFPGPPFNESGSRFCEDGDICTRNECPVIIADSDDSPTCETTDKACNNVATDLCCPEGCTPSDDLDCLTPENCESPGDDDDDDDDDDVPGDAQGGGLRFCALNKDAPVNSMAGAQGLLLMALGLGALVLLRRRHG